MPYFSVGDEDRQRQLSNSPHLSRKEKKIFGNCGTLEQMRIKMITYLMGRPARYLKKIEECEKQISFLEGKIAKLRTKVPAKDEVVRRKGNSFKFGLIFLLGYR